MKATIITMLCLLCCTATFAQNFSADSIAYQLQRTKINSMLAQRAQKFGLYEESLSQHTGIFGLQTKKDIRRSNEILMDIAASDNLIFKQIKILLDYRTFEQKQVESQNKDMEATNLNFMRTINSLRQQNALLKTEADKLQQDHHKTQTKYIVIIAVLIATSILLLLTRKRAVKA